MTDHSSLGPWVKRFLLEHVVEERNLTHNTQQSYRDAFCLLVPFASRVCKKPVDQLRVCDISAEIIRAFLIHGMRNSATISADRRRKFLLPRTAKSGLSPRIGRVAIRNGSSFGDKS